MGAYVRACVHELTHPPATILLTLPQKASFESSQNDTAQRMAVADPPAPPQCDDADGHYIINKDDVINGRCTSPFLVLEPNVSQYSCPIAEFDFVLARLPLQIECYVRSAKALTARSSRLST